MVPQEAQAVAEEETANDGSKTEEGLSGAYEEEQKRTEELRKLAYSLMPKDAVGVVEGAKVDADLYRFNCRISVSTLSTGILSPAARASFRLLMPFISSGLISLSLIKTIASLTALLE